MSHGNQSNSRSLIGPMRALLVVALAVCLLSTAVAQAVGLPTSPASGTSEPLPATSQDQNPTPAPSADVTNPPPTPEPTPMTAAVVTATVVTTTVVPTTPPSSDQPDDSPADQPADPSPDQLSHTVRQGETLAAIARTYGVSVDALVAANGIADADLLYIGQTLVIPDGSSTTLQEPGPLVPTDAPIAPTPIPLPALPGGITEERWIDVDLSEQRLTAYEGNTPVHSFLVSTGLPATPTPVGQFRIWIKLRTDDMAGADYYIEDVPFVMYFHEGYGLHGVTWHGNFGHPMSHGCVNLPTEEAEWLFDFAEVGTLVNIHE
jgi:lipoprotein-anchoring transpeptidase ErfK/SrfK